MGDIVFVTHYVEKIPVISKLDIARAFLAGEERKIMLAE